MPTPCRRVVDVETRPGRTVGPSPVFLQNAAVLNQGHPIRAFRLSRGVCHGPIAQPEIELAIFGRGTTCRLRLSDHRRIARCNRDDECGDCAEHARIAVHRNCSYFNCKVSPATALLFPVYMSTKCRTARCHAPQAAKLRMLIAL